MPTKDKTAHDLQRLLRVVETIRKTYPRMELGQLSVLLRVLLKPGIRAMGMTKETGLTASAVSRNVLALSDRSYLTDESGSNRRGLDLITQITDPLDSRARLLAPTARGRRLATRLSDLLGDDDNGTTERKEVAS